MTPIENRRRHILIHEMGHVLGMGHDQADCHQSPFLSTSIMVVSSEPTICFGAPITLQTEDLRALHLIYPAVPNP